MKHLGKILALLLVVSMLAIPAIDAVRADKGSQCWILLPTILIDEDTDICVTGDSDEYNENVYGMVELNELLEVMDQYGIIDLATIDMDDLQGLLELLAGYFTDCPGPVVIPHGECIAWASASIDELLEGCGDGDFDLDLSKVGAQGDVTFDAGGAWLTALVSDYPWGNGECDVGIGEIAEAPMSYDYLEWTTGQGLLWSDPIGLDVHVFVEVEIQSGPETVGNNNLLAVKFQNTAIDDGEHYLVVGALITSDKNPGFPTPEVTTAVLLGICLIGLGGFIFIRRKRSGKANS